MKWFFLILLVLVTVGGEMLVFGGLSDPFSVDRVGSAAAITLFCLALFAYWRASYFLEGPAQERGSAFAHSMLMLSFGAYCITLGIDMVILDACAYSLPSGSKVQGLPLLAGATEYFQERGLCPGLGYCFLLLGGVFSFPTLRFLFGVIEKTRHPPL